MRLPFVIPIIVFAAHPGWAVADDVSLCFTGSGNHRIDIDVCSRALRREISSPLTRATLLTKRGEAFLAARLEDLALRDIAKALENNPLSSRAYRVQGDAHFSKANYDLAIDSYRHALNLNMRSEKAYKQRGTAHLMLRRPRAAVADFDRSLAILPADPEVHALRAISLFAAGAYSEAEKGMTNALSQAYPYPLGYLWALASARKLGRSGIEHSHTALQETDAHIWPGPLVRSVIGIPEEGSSLDSAVQGQETLPVRHRMQTDFHLGLRAWSNGNRDVAIEFLRRVVSTVELTGNVEIPVTHLLLESLKE